MTESLRPEHVDPNWTRYPDTVLRFFPGADSSSQEVECSIDLRSPIGADQRALLQRIGFTIPFAILTAHDPRGDDLSPATNAARSALLEEELRASAIPFCRVDACSTGGEHCECSVAVAVGCDEALALARLYEQVAIFWYDGKRFWIVGTVADTEPIPLPRSA